MREAEAQPTSEPTSRSEIRDQGRKPKEITRDVQAPGSYDNSQERIIQNRINET